MKRIKENEINEYIKFFNNKNLYIQMQGIIKQNIFIENAHISFLNKGLELEIKNKENNLILNFSYIEEIYFLQKNKLKFLINHELEILITFL